MCGTEKQEIPHKLWLPLDRAHSNEICRFATGAIAQGTFSFFYHAELVSTCLDGLEPSWPPLLQLCRQETPSVHRDCERVPVNSVEWNEWAVVFAVLFPPTSCVRVGAESLHCLQAYSFAHARGVFLCSWPDDCWQCECLDLDGVRPAPSRCDFLPCACLN